MEDDDEEDDDEEERVLVAECILYTPAAYPLYDLEEDEEEEEEEDDDDDDDDEKQVWTPEEMRIKAKKEAEAKVKKALASINAAEKACGGLFADEFKLARIRACMDSLATGAAAAERTIRKIMMNCSCAKAMKALKQADRDLSDAVVLEC